MKDSVNSSQLHTTYNSKTKTTKREKDKKRDSPKDTIQGYLTALQLDFI